MARPRAAGRGGNQEIGPHRELDQTVKISIGRAADGFPVVIAHLHVEATRGAVRNPAPDLTQAENTQALAGNGRGVDMPLVLPSTGTDEAVGLKQVPGGCHQQHHGGVGDSGCVRVGTIGDGDASTPGCVEIDGLIAGADGADDLEIRKQCHLVAAEAATAVGQNNPDGSAAVAKGVYPARVPRPLANGVAGCGQCGYPFRSEPNESQDISAHDRCQLGVGPAEAGNF